jgi:hypothetical protein
VKIKGPGGPTQPPDVGETEKAQGPSGQGFADALGEAARTGGPSGPGAADPVGQVAADLKAGRLSPQQAVQKLMDLVVAAGPAAGLPAKVQAKIRADLENLVKEDPFLRSKLEKIGVTSREDE